jgi:anti-anti-sigma factor
MEIQEELPDPLSIDIKDGLADARLEGELSIHTVDTLKDPFFSLLNAQAIRLDLANVTDIDSCGLQLLIILKQQADLLNRKFTLTGTHPQLDQLLAVYQLTLPQATLAEAAP